MVDTRREEMLYGTSRSRPHLSYELALECVEYHRKEDIVDIKEV